MRSYRLDSCQAASCFGSFCGKLAFMGKSVFGRFSVFLSSSGSDMVDLAQFPSMPLFPQGVWWETSESSGNSVCSNEWQVVPAGRLRATNASLRESYSRGHLVEGFLRLNLCRLAADFRRHRCQIHLS